MHLIMFHIAIGHYSLINTLRSLHTFITIANCKSFENNFLYCYESCGGSSISSPFIYFLKRDLNCDTTMEFAL